MRVSVFGRGSIYVSPLGRYVGGGIGIILILLSLQLLASLVSYVYEAAVSRRWQTGVTVPVHRDAAGTLGDP